MVLASFAEIFNIAAILPLLRVLTAPELLFEHPAAQPLISILDLDSPQELLLPVTVLFICTTLLAATARFLLLWFNLRLSHAIGADFSYQVYQNTLYQPYSVHTSRNSAEVINVVSGKTRKLVTSVIMPLVTLLSSVLLASAILATLLAVNPAVAMAAIIGFALIYSLVVRLTRRRLARNSEHIAIESTRLLKTLNEGLGGIRDMIIDGTQPVYYKTYQDAHMQMRRALISNGFLGTAPRYGVEALGIVLLAVIAYQLANHEGGLGEAVPMLGVIALGSQRLLPILQQAYSAWVNIQGSRASLVDSLEYLEQHPPEYQAGEVKGNSVIPLPFKRSIQFRNMSFRYGEDGPNILREINLEFKKGDRVGIVGETGSGKSTFLDILMGLIRPTSGSMYVDDLSVSEENQRAWQSHIAHVPQSIYLADSSIKENIAFGIEKDSIDLGRVKEAARKANIIGTIESWPRGFDTVVGERGVRLSGGQRQRIGIARALYKQADVIIFDEATSALDLATESRILDSIAGLDSSLTLFIVAHRPATLEGCNEIVEIDRGLARTLDRRLKNYC
jgi:ATP-binding cassette subfamily B protein